MDRPIERVRALDRQPLDVLPDDAARVRAGGGRGGAGEERDRARAGSAREPTRRACGPCSAGASRARASPARRARPRRSGSPSTSRKWAITNPGARFSRTVKPPSTACATTPSGSVSASNARSRRNGLRVKARTVTAITDDHADEPGDRAVAELDQRVQGRAADSTCRSTWARSDSRARSRSVAPPRRSARSASARRARRR